MAKIAIIGAGGYVFPLTLISDVLSFPELRSSTFALMDIDAARLERTTQAATELVLHHGFETTILSTLDRREALMDADYVIVAFQVGGLAAYQHDVEIPRRYGVDQTVGDTLGPGGIFRFLRSAAVLNDLAEDMLELCPQALLLNYANPMAMNCWYLSELGIQTVGLCHSVQNTTHMLAQQLGVPYGDINYVVAGINHQAWILQLERSGRDLYPALHDVMRQSYLSNAEQLSLSEDTGLHSEAQGFSVYEGGQERLRTQLMEAFGYFHTESSHHASEYLPYFRKSAELIDGYLPERWDYFEICSSHDDELQTARRLEQLKKELRRSHEYGASIIHSMETGQPRVIYGNVPNHKLIDNLPEGCCVEVACVVDKNGVQATRLGKLPPQCAALNQSNVSVQALAVEAALTGKLEHLYHAVALDPLSSSLLTLDELFDMTSDLIEAQRAWLPANFQAPLTKSFKRAATTHVTASGGEGTRPSVS